MADKPEARPSLTGQKWTWKEVALVVGLVFLSIAVATVALWVAWNNPALF